MSDTPSTPIAVVNVPTKDASIIAFAQAVLQGFTGNASFPNPSPILAVFAADIAAYQSAQALALKKGLGAATQRTAKKKKVVSDLNHLCDYAQSVIENYPPEQGAAMIVGVGLSIKQPSKRAKAAISARCGAVSGEVLLDAKAVAATAIYYWSFSLDQKTWTSVPEMLKSSAVVTGLTPLQTYYFRFRATTRKGSTNYSQVVSLVVL